MMPAEIPSAPITGNSTVFLHGPAGAGKTTLARQRLRYLLAAGVAPRSVLVLVPQRTLGLPYRALESGLEGLPAGEAAVSPAEAAVWAPVDAATVGGLARRAVDLFWPLAAEAAGFARPHDPPLFLTLETAQYYMNRQAAQVTYYEGLTDLRISAPRLASQVLDNLNKAAVVGFPMDEIAERLKAAWAGPADQGILYDRAQQAARAFRDYCLAHNLLDFSLQVEVFTRWLLPRAEVQRFLFDRYRHVIADNVEEDTPVAHDLLREWLARCDSGLMLMDEDAGYRTFLGADPEGAAGLRAACKYAVEAGLPAAWHGPETRAIQALGERLAGAVMGEAPRGAPAPAEGPFWTLDQYTFFPKMIAEVADQISALAAKGVPPSEIVVLAPYLTDALRFALAHEMERYDIAVRSTRPSRSLAEEPATRCLLTLAALAHPRWRILPPAHHVAQALTLAIEEMDLVRAQLLTQIVYRTKAGVPELTKFDQIKGEKRERITYTLGVAWDRLREWLVEPEHQEWPLDVFLTMLFDEVLSRRGFAFRGRLDNAAVAARLIESVRKFRQAVPPENLPPERDLAEEYVKAVGSGILAATSLIGDEPAGEGTEQAVLLAPAYTFLLRNRPVDHQFWLHVGGEAWGERIYQPLTQPHVLSRRFALEKGPGGKWTDADEVRARRQSLSRLVLGLSRRCRRQVHLVVVDLDERGQEERGPLLRAMQRVRRAGQAARAGRREP